MRIHYKLILIIGILAILGIIISGTIYYSIGEQTVRERIEAQLNSIITLKGNQFVTLMEEEIEDIQHLANCPILKENFANMRNYSKGTTRYELHKMKIYNLFQIESEKDFFEIFAINMDGVVLVTTDKCQEGAIRANEQYFIEGKKDTFVQSFYYDTIIRKPAITISTPVRDKNQNIIGILAARVDMREISNLMIEKSGLEKTGETYLVNKFHYAVTALEFQKENTLKKVLHTKGVKDCLDGNNGYGHYNNYINTPVLGHYKWIPEYKICLIAEISIREAYAPIYRIRNYIILLTLLILISVLFLGHFFSISISRPIQQLHEATEELEKGNFTTRVHIKTDDELEELAGTFNKAARSLERLDEERKQIDKTKTRFLSITSHELRSPMTPMRGQLQMLLNNYFGKLNKKQKQSLNIVVRNTKRLDNIIKDFLEISRIEAARLKFNFVKIDITLHINRVTEEMKSFMPKKNIKIITKIDKLPIIEVDPDRVMQVLRNLMTNAVKFCKQNCRIKVSAKLKEGMILISVQDNGIGMSERTQAKLFEPFYQGEETMYRKYGGTGLGLAICRGIVESQHGKIWVKSKKGAGSTFYFTIPLKPIKKIKPIRVLFSEQKVMKKHLKEIFIEILGPLGKTEFQDLVEQKILTKEKLFKYIDSLYKHGIIDPTERLEFKREIKDIVVGTTAVSAKELKKLGLTK